MEKLVLVLSEELRGLVLFSRSLLRAVRISSSGRTSSDSSLGVLYSLTSPLWLKHSWSSYFMKEICRSNNYRSFRIAFSLASQS